MAGTEQIQHSLRKVLDLPRLHCHRQSWCLQPLTLGKDKEHYRFKVCSSARRLRQCWGR